MSDDAIVYLGYTVNTVALCSLGCCYGHRVLRTRDASTKPQVLAYVDGCGFANVGGDSLDPYHFQYGPMTISQLARDILAQLGTSSDPNVQIVLANASTEVVETFTQAVLDRVETLGGFDLSEYEVDDEDDLDLDDEDDEDDEDDDLDDRWPGDTDDDEDEEEAP